MKGCADRQRKRQLLLGGSSHTGGWRVEAGKEGKGGGEEVQDFDLPELQVRSGHRRYPSLRQTDRSRSAVHWGRISGPFITIFS